MRIKRKIAGLTAGLLLLAGSAQAATYTVQPEDTLWKISMKHNTTISELMRTNQLTSDMIYPGQKLQVPGPIEYRVQTNETMWIISQKFSISLDALIKANPQIPNPNNIWTGMTVLVPQSVSSSPVVMKPSPTVPAPTKPAVPSPAELTDGLFPLAKGTYQAPLTNSYSVERSWTPTGESVRKHEGVDINAAKGTPIYSVLDGEIINFGWNTYGGYRVTVRVNDSTVLYYAHLSKYAEGLGKGTKVKKGQLLGYVGSTGYGPEGTEGQFIPHLHFGIYKTSGSTWTSIDPFPYLQWWEANL